MTGKWHLLLELVENRAVIDKAYLDKLQDPETFKIYKEEVRMWGERVDQLYLRSLKIENRMTRKTKNVRMD